MKMCSALPPILLAVVLLASTAVGQQQKKTISDPAEYNAFVMALNVPDPTSRIQSLEHFLQKYPNSVVKEDALTALMQAGQQARDAQVMVDAARRVLEINPNSVPALAVIVVSDQKEGTADSISEAQDLSIRGLNNLQGMSKPNNVTDQVFEQQKEQLAQIFRTALNAPVPNRDTTPTAKTGKLTITTSPGSAQVYVDDEFKGVSSDEGRLVVNGLKPGSHNLRLDLLGYKEVSQTIAIAAGKTRDFNAELPRKGPEGLSEAEIEEALRKGMTPLRVKSKVEEFGVSFAMNDDIERRLRDAGADAELLLAIEKHEKN